VTITGAVTRTATTDSQQAYSFTALPCGTYVVTPSFASVTFDPPSATVGVQGNAQEDFTAVVCNSAPAGLSNPGGTCMAEAGQVLQMTVSLLCNCTDSSASCQALWVGNHLELAPAVMQCSNVANCATSGCDVTARTASCFATIPAAVANGVYPIIDGSGGTVGTLVVGASAAACSL
jgi:hypothetical protein